MLLVRILAIILAVIIVLSLGFMIYKTGEYMIHQKFSFHDAWEWALMDLENVIDSLGFKADAEPDCIEYNIVNRFVDVMPCVNLR